MLQAATKDWTTFFSSSLPQGGLHLPWAYEPYSQWRRLAFNGGSGSAGRCRAVAGTSVKGVEARP